MPFELLKIRHQGPTRGNPTSGVVKSPPSKLLKVRKIVADVSSISTKLDTGYRKNGDDNVLYPWTAIPPYDPIHGRNIDH